MSISCRSCRSLLVVAFALILALPAEARKFRILSFNILVDRGPHWDARKVQVGEFIRKNHPDVFGLQEPTKPQMDDLAPYLKDYAYVGVARDDGKEQGEYSPVYYRTDRYRALKSGTFWLSETPEAPSYGWDANCRRVCSWALLQDKVSGKLFVFANTHLDHIGKVARRNGALLIKERLTALVPAGTPLMVTGDFNVEDTEEAYITMTTGGIPLGDAYKMARKRTGCKTTFHAWGKIPDEKAYKIDFIFLSPQLKVKRAEIFNSYLAPDQYLSDHHPHFVDLKW